jgi:hypothetical protein
MAAIAVPRLMQNATDAESGGGLISTDLTSSNYEAYSAERSNNFLTFFTAVTEFGHPTEKTE